MIKHSRSPLVLVLMLLLAGLLQVVAAPVASAGPPTIHYTVAANRTCHQKSGLPGAWDQNHTFTYRLHPENIRLAPPWCANVNGGMLAILNNGDFVLTNNEISSGAIIWHTPQAANHGATIFQFNRLDGSMKTYWGGTLLWSSGPWYYCTGAANQFNTYRAVPFTNRWMTSLHVDQDCLRKGHWSQGKTMTRTMMGNTEILEVHK